MFCKSPTVATAFGVVAFAKSTRFDSGLAPSLPFGAVVTGALFNDEATPVICVGFPSAELTFNAVVGLLSPLLLAGLAFSVLNSTGDLPSSLPPTFTVLNSTSSLVANVNLPSA